MSQLELKALQIRHVGPVDLTVSGGTITCVSGESGSGKSILLRAIADMLPHAGDVCLDEQCANTTSPPLWRRQVGLLPAETEWWYETVEEHFTDKDDELLSKMGFAAKTWHWTVSDCSTGERQRLGILRCLSNKPRALLLDEPTASLDPENISRVEQLILEYVKNNKVPVIWVSHSREQIQRIAGVHYKMKDGKLVKQ